MLAQAWLKMMAMCICSGEWKVNDVWEPRCIKAKPDNEKQVLQAVQSAMQALPGPHHLSCLLAYYPPGGTDLGWAENEPEVWFVTE